MLGTVQVPAASADPSLSAGMAPLQYFLGNWDCTGGSTGKPKRSAKLAYEADLGGALIERQVDVPAVRSGKAFVSATHYAYDAGKHRLVANSTDGQGAWAVSTTTGWNGVHLTWTDIASSDGSLGRNVLKKVSATLWTESDYAKIKGKDRLVFTGACTKAP